MGTDLRRWIEEYAYALAFDPETIRWCDEMHDHLERCRQTGEDPFPDAITVDELRARCAALIDGSS